jgi:uncharacterized protein (TIGR02246 family)
MRITSNILKRAALKTSGAQKQIPARQGSGASISRPKSALDWNLVLCTLLACVALGGGFASPQDKTAIDTKREPDRLALEKLSKAMIQAFDHRDAAAIAANWTDEGEFVHNDGEPIRGRTEIQKGYAEFFNTLQGKPKLEIQSDSLRFPSADTAVTDTTLRLKDDEGEIVACGRQNTLAVREDGQWKIAIVREWDRDTALDANLKDLDWLVGTWQAATEERQVTITYEWDANKAFLRGKFSISEGGKVSESGTQIIGNDNAKRVIRAWVFQADGGFGDEVWSREGKKWSVDVHAVRADGKVLTATNIYIQVAPDTVTWQAVNQTLDGVPITDTPPLKVTKQNSAK